MTDKERLEDIKTWLNRGFDLTEEDIEWLIEQAERVQELEGTVKHAMKAIDNTEAVRVKLINAEQQNKRYRKALEEIMKIQENHEWNLYGLAYGIAERILFDLEGEEIE